MNFKFYGPLHCLQLQEYLYNFIDFVNKCIIQICRYGVHEGGICLTTNERKGRTAEIKEKERISTGKDR